LVQILHAMMLAGAPSTLLKGAICIYVHITPAEGFWTLMEGVKPTDLRVTCAHESGIWWAIHL
jgi:hypothetical protein